MRAAFFGTGETSARYLAELVKDVEVTLVVTRPAKRRGRSGQVTSSPVDMLAQRLGIPVVAHWNFSLDVFDFGLVVAFGRLIPEAIVSKAPLFNVHYSLLPAYRGAAPIERAILAGEEVSGVSLMRLVPEMDAGGVIASANLEIADLDASDVRTRMTDLGLEMVRSFLGEPNRFRDERGVPQRGRISLAPKLSAEDFRIRPFESAEMSVRRVRLGRAFGYFERERVRILSATAIDGDAVVPIGTVVDCGDNGPGVSCAKGLLAIGSVRPEGRKGMSFADYVRGRRGQLVLSAWAKEE